MSQEAQLRKCKKMEFHNSNSASIGGTGSPLVSRERSFVRSNKDSQKRRSQTMATLKGGGGGGGGAAGKPIMEIYRPPNVRTDLPMAASGKLNVHAKEFTMNHQHDLQSSKSSGNLNFAAMGYEHHMPTTSLQHSKSSGNILRQMSHPGLIPLFPSAAGAGMAMPAAAAAAAAAILHSASTSQILNHHHHQQMAHRSGSGPSSAAYHHHYPPEMFNMAASAAAAAVSHPVFSGLNHPGAYHPGYAGGGGGNAHRNSTKQTSSGSSSASALKRSKSLGATDSRNLADKLKSIVKEELDVTIFPDDQQTIIKAALEDPNQLPTRTLMDLVKTIMEKAVEGIKYSEPIAKLCISIIENEKKQTFLETLLNTCQQWYQERDKILRGIKAGDGTRFTAFMWFLTEMCGHLKRHQLKENFKSLQPELTLLSILAKCCQACVSLPIKCLSETECLFFVLTSIGRDLESELPQQLEQLLASVRDGFLTGSSASVRRTLLQLIELHASNWQLPGSSVLYYYPRIK
ncbi:unnamed protein product [Acanthoscelides obtectus]|uniref:MIF4G domain-containing protein n=1 Tax=Acanthoscelides obtectus TaxID=200917 RepID=A0A9P0JT80_ACAOB|nr:unnamed protein product [Acanthoscelides obtectus]CAK1637338.1 MIF4G domain-containing protein [Acanthoscelides obtectus]